MKIPIYYEDKEVYTKEFLGAILKKLRLSGFSVGALGLVFAFVTYKDNSLILAGLLLGAGIVSILTAILVLPMTYKEFKQASKKATGGESQVLVRFFDDRAEIHQGKSHLEIAYKNIERVFTTDALYIFQLGKTSGFYIPKGAITDEDREDFQALLDGPLAHLPRKPRGFFSNK